MSNNKKEKIIQHAFDLFAEKGYSDTSMDDIVKSSGISKGGIYYYFRSKEEIFLEIANDRLKQRNRITKEGSKDISSKEKLVHYIHWTLTGLFEEKIQKMARFTFEFWSVLARKPNMSRKAKERYEMFYNDLAEILQKGVDSGEFEKNMDVSSMAYIILSTMDGIGYMNSVMGIPITPDIVENYVDMILKKMSRSDSL